MVMTLAPKPKLEKILPREGLADFLRQLADQAQSGAIAFPGGDVPLSGMKDLKISIKDAGRDLAVKVRLKFPKPEAAPAAADSGAADLLAGQETREGVPAGAVRPRYKGLKKRMKRDFKDIGASLAAGAAPRSDTLAAFVADSRLMTTYRGKGDEQYPDYLAAVDRFEAAWAAGDLEAAARAYRELALCKKACHARHA
jgi:XXXCH domain-containing protein